MDWIHPAQDKKPVSGFHQHGNECLGSIQGREFLKLDKLVNIFVTISV
jgi:hypothetical protein